MRAQPRDVPCQGRAGSNFRVFPIVAHRDGATNMRLGTRTIYGMWCQCVQRVDGFGVAVRRRLLSILQ